MIATPMPLSEAEVFAIARRVARGNAALAEEAAQHVQVQHARELFDPRRGAFATWTATLCRRYCSDALNRPFRAAGGDDPLPEAAARDASRPAFESRYDFTIPFCEADRAAVLALPPRHRFVLLAWHGLWDKLTRDDQRRTLAVVEPAEPFPVPDFFAWPDRDRADYLARLLRCPPNTVAQIRHRHRRRLAGLRFVRELQGSN